MPGHTTANMDALIRSEVWSNQLKDVLEGSPLMAERFVRWLPDFGATQLTIPSIGDLGTNDYVEDQAVQYEAMDTGEYHLTGGQYVSSATYITNKAKQDLFYMNELVSSFVPKQARAIRKRLELDIWKEGQPRTGNPAGYQVAGDLNAINGVGHRFVASGSFNSVPTLSAADFAKARYSLQKANVPLENLVAIVDPATEFAFNNTPTVLGLGATVPAWENIMNTGIAQGNRFIMNLYGFDIYTSDWLPLCGQNQSGTSETIDGDASGANAVCNLFFSASADVLPWVGVWKQQPKVDGEYNKDFQREEYVTTARYLTGMYRPENFVTILSSTAVI